MNELIYAEGYERPEDLFSIRDLSTNELRAVGYLPDCVRRFDEKYKSGRYYIVEFITNKKCPEFIRALSLDGIAERLCQRRICQRR